MKNNWTKSQEKITELSKLKNRALYWLSKRDYSQAKFLTKLQQVCDDELLIANVMQEYISSGYLDDQRYIQVVYNNKVASGLGLFRVKQELQKAGFERPLIELTVEEKSTDWFENAVTTYMKKYGETLPADKDYKEQGKRFRYMQYRGFGPDEIKYAMSQVGSES